MIDVVKSVGPQLGGVLLGQKLTAHLQRPQRLLQVMRNHVRERLEFTVDAEQALVGPFEFIAASTQFVGQVILHGQIEGRTAEAHELPVVIGDGDRIHPDINNRAVLLAPLGFEFALTRRRRLGNRDVTPPRRCRQQ